MIAYILAGGHSTRMGRPKARLVLGGRSFADRIIDACEPVFDEVVAVTRFDGEPIDRVRTVHEHPHDGTSPMFGLEAALDDAREAQVWVIGIDYPLVTADLLRWLASKFARSESPILVPSWGETLQTLCAGYSTDVSEEVSRRIADGRFRLRDLAKDHSAIVVDEAEIREAFPGELLMNVNTPEELDEAMRIVGEHGEADGGTDSSR